MDPVRQKTFHLLYKCIFMYVSLQLCINKKKNVYVYMCECVLASSVTFENNIMHVLGYPPFLYLVYTSYILIFHFSPSFLTCLLLNALFSLSSRYVSGILGRRRGVTDEDGAQESPEHQSNHRTLPSKCIVALTCVCEGDKYQLVQCGGRWSFLSQRSVSLSPFACYFSFGFV